MAGDQRAHRLRQLRGGLALCLAVLLAIMPLAQLVPTVAPQAALAASASTYAPNGDAPRGEDAALALEEDRPDARILPRLPQLKETFAPPAPKALLQLDASIAPLQSEKAGREKVTGTGVHRSSVGTARKPTGPPA